MNKLVVPSEKYLVDMDQEMSDILQKIFFQKTKPSLILVLVYLDYFLKGKMNDLFLEKIFEPLPVLAVARRVEDRRRPPLAQDIEFSI